MSTLILLRHGQSTWNEENLFTGWVDVDLTAKGEAEAVRGGELLVEAGVLPEVVHTSLQKRAIRTAEIALRVADRSWIPVRRSWRLNERHYGDLQGKNKAKVREEFGDEKLPRDLMPRSECLADVIERMLPYWYDGIVPDLEAGHVTLVAAHGNSLRGLVKHLDGISEDKIVDLNIPTGQPLVYELDPELSVVHRRYLDPDAAAAAAEAVKKQAG